MGRSQSRAAARVTVLLAALGGFSGVGWLVVHGSRGERSVRPPPPIADGWHVTGMRHAGRDGAGGLVRVRAGDLASRRVRVGPFRLGFARHLEARDLDILVRVAASGSPDAALGGWRPVGAGGVVTSIDVESARLRVRRGRASFDVTASRATAGWTGNGRVRLGGPVRIRGRDVDLTLPEIDFDPRAGRFVAASQPVDPMVVARANAAMASVGDATGADVTRVMRRLATGMQQLP